MTFNIIKQAIYGLYSTNLYGYKLKKIDTPSEIKRLRLEYSQKQLQRLNIKVHIQNDEKLPKTGQFLVVCNHRSIIDPPIVEVALAQTEIFGPWVSKKELYNSLFFGLFVRNAGSILLDRQKAQMSGFFTDIKEAVKRGESIFIFPEGTRNKTEHPLTSFKEGSRIIALKNRLPILPIYIQTHANELLQRSLKDTKATHDVNIVIGDVIDYKDKTNLEENYRKIFSLED